MASPYSLTQTGMTTVYSTTFLSNVKEYHSIECSEQFHDVYEELKSIVAAHFSPFRLEYWHVESLVSSMMDFVRDHAISMVRQDASIFCDEDDPYCASRERYFLGSARRPDAASFRIMHEYMLMDMYEIFVDSLFKGLKNHDEEFAAFVRLLHGVLYPSRAPRRHHIPKSAGAERSPEYVTLRGSPLLRAAGTACAAADGCCDS
jgi:hypothetical protein